MKRLLITGIVLLLLQFLLADEALPDIGQACIIKWWGGSTGYVTTNETNRTEQARHEAFQAIFGEPDCSGPCIVNSNFCYPMNGNVPGGCDGFGDWGEINDFLGEWWCYCAMLCDTGEWEYSSINYDGDGLVGHTSGLWDVLCGIDTDSDGIPDLADNCPHHQNGSALGTCILGNRGLTCTNHADCGEVGYCSMNQEDTYPPQGNGIGDACDCEGNFYCDTDNDVDGSDAALFKDHFGRSNIDHPCIAEDPCIGDFNCDDDVDGSDASLFKADFGRSSMQNPCPVCVVEQWCSYQ